VTPFDLAVQKEQGWYLTFRKATTKRADFAAFLAWLRKEASAEAQREIDTSSRSRMSTRGVR